MDAVSSNKKATGKAKGGNPAWVKGGKSPNPRGRALAGNKSATMKAKVTRFLVKNMQPKKLQDIMDKLDAPGKAKFLTDLLPYAIPKQSSLTVGTPFDDLSDNDLDRMLTKILGPAQQVNALQEPLQTQQGQVLLINHLPIKENGVNGQE